MAKAKKDDGKSKDQKKTEDAIVYIAIYIFTIVSGVIAYLVANDNERMKFHALQAIFLGIILWLLPWFLAFMPFVGYYLADLIDLLIFVYGIYLGYEAGWEDTDMLIPFLGEYAEQWSGYKVG